MLNEKFNGGRRSARDAGRSEKGRMQNATGMMLPAEDVRRGEMMTSREGRGGRKAGRSLGALAQGKFACGRVRPPSLRGGGEDARCGWSEICVGAGQRRWVSDMGLESGVSLPLLAPLNGERNEVRGHNKMASHEGREGRQGA